MPKLADTPTLDDYSKLSISSYRDYLKQHGLVKTVTVSYNYLGNDHSITINISNTPCTYGGHRHWWQCPKCGRRVAVLYFNQSYQCRHCIGLNYQSQLQQPVDKLLKRVAVIRERLGWPQGIVNGHGGKPRGMWQKTYDKLVIEHDELSQKIIERLI